MNKSLCKARFFTLIELLLSLATFSFLLMLLFFWIRSISVSTEEYQALETYLKEESLAQQQLQSILPKAEDPDYFFSTDEVPSKTLGDTLIFVYDRGVSMEPLLSGRVLARLYIDLDHTLCLAIWPHPTEKKVSPTQKMRLLENVSDLHFTFFHPPDPFPKVVDPEGVDQPHPLFGEQASWSSRYKSLPAFVKIHLDRRVRGESHPLTLTYELPSSKHYIVYQQE